MNDLINRLFATMTAEDAEGKSYPLDSSISREDGDLIARMIKERDAVETLEVGMAHGLSTLFFCQSHENLGRGRHTAVDPMETRHWHSLGLLNVERAGLSGRLRFFEEGSETTLPRLLQDGERFDLIFIDGLHLFDQTLVEFFYADKLLKIGGLVMFHDIWVPAIRKVAAYVLRNRAYRELPVPAGKNSLARRTVRYLRNLGQNRYDFYSSGLLIDGRILNTCVLEKQADDDRPWSHYRSF